MLQFAFEGITSFSVKPLRLITLLGVLIFNVSVVMIVYFFVRYFSGYTVSGWASIACSVWGIGGLLLFSIGIVGEYTGKIYLETKRRPRYHVEQFLFGQEKKNEEQ
jgi:glycosyltransferase involved in cell wall biosynthesis